MKQVYFGSFDSLEQMVKSFASDWSNENEFVNKRKSDILESLKDAEILFAAYGGRFYEGCAFVLFRKNNKLFEVNASHCSCFGLEGTWEPEETTLVALNLRKEKGTILPDEEFEPDAIKRLDELLQELNLSVN